MTQLLLVTEIGVTAVERVVVGMRLESAAGATLEPHNSVHWLEGVIQASVHEPDVVVIVRILGESLPVDGVDLVEFTVVPSES